jgi:hypothetical protein
MRWLCPSQRLNRIVDEEEKVPKGGLDMSCSLVFALVLFVLETDMFCSLRVIFYRWCSSALLYGLLYCKLSIEGFDRACSLVFVGIPVVLQ